MTDLRMAITKTAQDTPRLESPVARANAFDLAVRLRTGRVRLPAEAAGPELGRIGSLFETMLCANEATAHERGGTRDMVFGWLDAADGDPLAVVARHPTRSLCAVGISRALPSLLADTFGAAFANPAFLPEVGLSGAEAPRLPPGDGCIARVIARRSGSLAIGSACLDEALRPVDDARAHAAELCARLALEFGFLHLAQHVFGGHSTANVSLDGDPPQALTNLPRGVTPTRAAERHQHEIHADTWAATAIARMLLRGSTVLLSDRDLVVDQVDPIRLLGLAILASWRLESEVVGPPGAGCVSDHPDPVVRWAAITNVVSENLAKVDEAVATRWRDSFELALDDERAFAEALGLEAQPTPADVAILEASTLLDALRERKPRLRWMHQLVVPS